MESRQCWAATLSGCGGGLSAEHLVTKALFKHPMISVAGFDWCDGEERLVSVNRLTSRCLCRRHNNMLSPVDQEVVRLDGALRDYLADTSQNRTLKLSGFLLERWLLKTAITNSVNGKLHIGVGFTDSVPGRPSRYLVEAAFGLRPLEFCMGLYVIGAPDRSHRRFDQIALAPITKDGVIGAVHLHMRGFDLLLSLFPGHSAPPLQALGLSGLPLHLLESTPAYRPSAIGLESPSGALLVLELAWA